ncbi:unnamed protein product [Paramecium sonneborni]|uniref:Uncharacterized protein n=1 Tax=Paramecium sonneborni TaxID=65129 RepID=A0A8S1QSS6_9CILI|nr:unnamed protein product [Paramecium sonneborni]
MFQVNLEQKLIVIHLNMAIQKGLFHAILIIFSPYLLSNQLY